MLLTNANSGLSGLKSGVRQPAVAGSFYPDEPDALGNMVQSYLDAAATTSVSPKAIIAPHAGYRYSGPIAASAYASLLVRKSEIRRVVLLGPAHCVYVKGLALAAASRFASPLGEVALDLAAIRRLEAFPQVCVLDEAHAQEHSLEVHLPFLQCVLDEFLLLPMLVGEASAAEVSEVLEALWGGDETLIVVSSDLSHYHDYETALRIDQRTSRAIQALRADEIGPHEACGCRPLHGLLNIARQRGMSVALLDLRNSGDTAGARDRVVGYGAYALCLPENDSFSAAEQESLRKIARESIEQGFTRQQALVPEKGQYPAKLAARHAAFVSLSLGGKLRGCMGSLQATAPLVEGIAQSAFKAAFHDPRFRPLTRDEFSQTELGISILMRRRPLAFASEAELLQQLRPGTDGLVIEKGQRSATFLPVVWETLAQPQDFLAQLKAKAGMGPEVPDKAWCYATESF